MAHRLEAGLSVAFESKSGTLADQIVAETQQHMSPFIYDAVMMYACALDSMSKAMRNHTAAAYTPGMCCSCSCGRRILHCGCVSCAARNALHGVAGAVIAAIRAVQPDATFASGYGGFLNASSNDPGASTCIIYSFGNAATVISGGGFAIGELLLLFCASYTRAH
jgi:hypothetical protein